MNPAMFRVLVPFFISTGPFHNKVVHFAKNNCIHPKEVARLRKNIITKLLLKINAKLNFHKNHTNACLTKW